MSVTERQIEEALDLFMMPGWKTLMDEVEEQMDLLTVDSCSTAEDLWFSKGRLAVLRMFFGYEDYVRSSSSSDDDDYDLQ